MVETSQQEECQDITEEVELQLEDRIKEVWSHNMYDEFKNICRIVKDFPYVALDTEFPGVVAKPVGEFKSNTEYQYQLLRCNVDLLKIIQLGMTFFNEDGELPEGVCTWQFNFKFSLSEDMYASNSFELLQNSGIQFDRHEREGIESVHFAEFLLTSGSVLVDNVKWLSFAGGYDFGYLMALLTNTSMPEEESEFFETLKLYFPNVYDVKYLMKNINNLKGGLQEVADMLQVERIGSRHQAGSDSLITGKVFFKIIESYYKSEADATKYLGYLYGYGTNHVGGRTNSESSPDI